LEHLGSGSRAWRQHGCVAAGKACGPAFATLVDGPPRLSAADIAANAVCLWAGCGQDVGGMWVRRQPNPVLRRYHSAPPNWLRRLQTARQKPMDALDKRLTLVALYDVTASACLPKAGGGRIAMMVSRSQSMTAFWTSPVCARVVLAAGGRASSRGIPDVLDDPFAAGDGPAPRPLQTP
jgi:hypothetical protein